MQATANESIDFGATFARLEAAGEREHKTVLGGVEVRLVRVPGGGVGRFDKHDDTPETVVVWRGTFDVTYRDRVVTLTTGQCCVVPAGAEHYGTSAEGADVVLFKGSGHLATVHNMH